MKEYYNDKQYIEENNARYDRLRQLDIESLDRAYRRFEKIKHGITRSINGNK